MSNIFFYITILFSLGTYGQKISVSGSGNAFANQKILLKRIYLFTEIDIEATIADNNGNFTINCDPTYRGAAILQFNTINKILLLLNNEDITLVWNDVADIRTLQINSTENKAFLDGMEFNQYITSKRIGLEYLAPYYQDDADKNQFFAKELDNIYSQFSHFLDRIDDKLYAKKYLRWRGLVSDITTQKNSSRFSHYKASFLSINFMDMDLQYSGLIYDLVEGYTLLCKTSGLDAASEHIIAGIDHVTKSLADDPETLILLNDMWFRFLEQRGMDRAAEYLAITMLNNDKCHVTEQQLVRYEQYRRMAIGRPAPNLDLPGVGTLSSLSNKYKLIIFGSSWCPNCQNDYPTLLEKYHRLKDLYNLEIVYISLDTERKAFNDFYKDAPFITLFGGNKWDTKAAKDYYVFATPTMFLLDRNLNIVQKPKNIDQAEEWLANR